VCVEAIVNKLVKRFVGLLYATQCAARALKQRKKPMQWHSSQVDGLDATESVAHAEEDDAHGLLRRQKHRPCYDSGDYSSRLADTPKYRT
jgi:hypothetical protein